MTVPASAQNAHIAVVGTTGSGKTHTGMGLVGEFLKAGKRVCVIDPTGCWWGLRSNADGNGPGYPIVIFGGEHADVPIAETSGAAVAALVASRNLPAIIDLSEMLQDAQIRFMLDFSMAIYAANKMPLHLVIDEADEFAPQNPMNETKRVLHHVQRIARRGRVKGFRLLLITQRPAVLHKNVLTQANTLIAMRLTGPQDRNAIRAWIEGQADEEKGREVLDSLPQLATGEGWVWAPAQGVLTRTQFPRNSTFDSSRTPEDGESIEPPATIADVDVSAIRASLEPPAAEDNGAGTGKRARGAPATADDLGAAEARGYERGKAEGLRLRADALRTDLSGVLNAIGDARAEHHERFEKIERMAQALVGGYAPNDEDHASPPLRTAPPAADHSPKAENHPPRAPTPRRAPTGDGKVTGPQQRILDALAWLESAGIAPANRIQVGLASGYSPSSGNFQNTLGAMRTAGLIKYPRDGQVALTDAGRALATKAERRLTSADLHRTLEQLLSGTQWKVLKVVIDRYPEVLTRAAVAAGAGYSPDSGNFQNTLGSLRSLELIDYPESGKVVALPVLFLKGRR